MGKLKYPIVLFFFTLFFTASILLAAEVAEVANPELIVEEQIIVVASSQEEPLKEAPVITSVITAEEIRKMGARNLNDVLLTLPGFSRTQDHNEYYSAERGIYGSSQQKILVLRDGHRLNARCYSEANFGPAISLENVKRIEIMRGPGASLYGDVALTAVVNIVTKEASDVEGMNLNAGYGNYGQRKLDLLYGKQYGEKNELVVWGSLYKSDGQSISVPASRDYSAVPRDGKVVVDGFNSHPAYDLGIKHINGFWSVSYAHRYDHYLAPRGMGGGWGQLIDIDEYRKFMGEKPGSSSEFQNFEVKYAPEFQSFSLTIRPYFDTFTFRDNEVQKASRENTTGRPQSYYMEWNERSYGIQTLVNKQYSLSSWGKGTALAGVQFDLMDLFDSYDIHSPDPTHTGWYMPETKVLPVGQEKIYSTYGQIKHKFTDNLVANVGGRYDYKDRVADNVKAFSPRAAFMYLSKRIDYRLSYGRSFVDAPYWYRENASATGGYQGSRSLQPEKLNTYQFTLTTSWPYLLSNQLNFFYNDYTNVVYRDNTKTPALYCNAGTVKTKGLEYEIGIRQTAYSLRANYTYQEYWEVLGYSVQEGMLANIPKHLGNVIFDFAPFARLAKDFWLNLQARYIGKQFAPYGFTAKNYQGTDITHLEKATVLANVGFTYSNFLANNLELRGQVYNLFDKKYFQGGSVMLAYEQPGRWYLVQLSLKI